MSYEARRCSARRNDGRPCRAWAMRDSVEALCSSHLNRRSGAPDQPEPDETADSTGFYEPPYDMDVMADLLVQAEQNSLKDELSVTRLAVRRVLEQLQREMDAEEFARLIGLVFKGTHTIASIMRAQRALSKSGRAANDPDIDAARKEFLKEHGIEG